MSDDEASKLLYSIWNQHKRAYFGYVWCMYNDWNVCTIVDMEPGSVMIMALFTVWK